MWPPCYTPTEDDTLMIKVKVFPSLAKRSKSGLTELELAHENGLKAGDIVQREGFTGPEAEAILLIVNGQQAAPDTPLADGDRVELMLAIAGG